jgi:hypothetical protein
MAFEQLQSVIDGFEQSGLSGQKLHASNPTTG